jgi:5'-nucleotidase
MGRQHFWFTVSPVKDVEDGTDRWAVQHDLISITPLLLELTDEKQLERIRSKALAPAA